jgi:hypothetical protein
MNFPPFITQQRALKFIRHARTHTQIVSLIGFYEEQQFTTLPFIYFYEERTRALCNTAPCKILDYFHSPRANRDRMFEHNEQRVLLSASSD